MEKYRIENNSQMFNINYDKILAIATEEEQKKYTDFEKEYNRRNKVRTEKFSKHEVKNI